MQLYDFYFSEKQLQIARFCPIPYIHAYFKEQEYTQRVHHGIQFTSNWDDMVFLGTGTNADVTFK